MDSSVMPISELRMPELYLVNFYPRSNVYHLPNDGYRLSLNGDTTDQELLGNKGGDIHCDPLHQFIRLLESSVRPFKNSSNDQARY